MSPIIDKSIDVSRRKNINAFISTIEMEIQDSYWQILNPEPQALEFTRTKVYNEDEAAIYEDDE